MLSEATLKRKYNLTLDQFFQLFEACGRRCTTCGKPFDKWTRPPCVDHDHKTGLVRGLLCLPCNDAIGFRHDNQQWFERVGRYLAHPPAILTIGTIYVPGSPGEAGVL